MAAPIHSSPANPTVIVWSDEGPCSGVDILCVFPNKTWNHATTDKNGEARVYLYASVLPITVFAARKGFAASIKHRWIPVQGALSIQLKPLTSGGFVIIPESSGEIPGLLGQVNPILDEHGRTYLYASKIAIDGGKAQPVHFDFGSEIHPVDSNGSEVIARIVHMVGRSTLLEYYREQSP